MENKVKVRNETLGFDEKDKWKSFFEENGYVVVRGVLSEEQIQKTREEMFSHRALLGRFTEFNPEDPSTWEENWPEAAKKRGFLNPITSTDNPHGKHGMVEFWNNLQNENAVAVFSEILGTSKLQVDVDRYGAMRPTKAIETGSEKVDKPEWITEEGWLHWDQNPWHEPDQKGLQGLLTLSEQTATSGGFECSPGMHKQFASWAKNYPVQGKDYAKGYNDPIMVPSHHPAHQHRTRILAPPGSLIVWDSRLAHCNYPNTSSQFRLVQYLTYWRWKSECFDEEHEKQLAQANLSSDWFNNLTPLGQKLLMLKRWDEQDNVMTRWMHVRPYDNEEDMKKVEQLIRELPFEPKGAVSWGTSKISIGAYSIPILDIQCGINTSMVTGLEDIKALLYTIKDTIEESLEDQVQRVELDEAQNLQLEMAYQASLCSGLQLGS